MNLVSETRRGCPELAAFLEECCHSPLSFDGDDPNYHSYLNHIHLWALEWWAERLDWVDLDYRVAFVETIFRVWRGRAKGLAPYSQGGFLVYLYEDLAPTVSIVAATSSGFPYDPENAEFANSIRDVMSLYTDRRWSDNFAGLDWPISRDRILQVVERNHGSIGRQSASALGLPVGKLRILIEQMGLERQVNDLRKQHKRRPAKFRLEDPVSFDRKMLFFEQHWPAGYR